MAPGGADRPAVEPVAGEPAALANLAGERALVVADYHAGIEVGLRREGVELPSDAQRRRETLVALVDRETPDRLVVLGDFGHAIGDPRRDEQDELRDLFEALPASLSVTVTKGNHDGGIEDALSEVAQSVDVTPGHGVRLGPVGFAHGHTWPSPAVLEAEILCVAHEHPVVRLEDDVGGRRVERVWLRGGLAPEPFETFHDRELPVPEGMVVCPAFNERSGGTWVNVAGREFLSPFLPEGLVDGEAYLLDGTRLGAYERL